MRSHRRFLRAVSTLVLSSTMLLVDGTRSQAGAPGFTASGPLRSPDSAFISGATYVAGVKDPGAFLGYPLGARPARYTEVVAYFTYMAGASPRVRLVDMGRTYEGRTQYHAVVTDEANHARMESIRRTLARIASGERDALPGSGAESAPLIAWVGYGVHGDELSSVDAAMHVLYHYAAGSDPATVSALKNLVICIEPMQNPDGRERFLGQMEQWRGPVPNPDAQSIQHTGTWPYGRGNHYLFDLNRDWFFLTQVESRNRVAAMRSWQPQVVIDSHEMGSYDTYLFSPPREPVNPHVPAATRKWWNVFAGDQAKAFDRHGWSYYTREWLDEWYPGYGSSWSLYLDAIGILYEQAGVDGSLVKRPDGTTLTYREAVHHHIVSSVANLTTASENRGAILADFAAARRSGVTVPKNGPRLFLFPPGQHASRRARLAANLLHQGIDVRVADEAFRVGGVRDYFGATPASRQFPAGTLVVSVDQPAGRLALALLEADPRMPNAVLQEERKAVEKDRSSRQYDVSAWSLPLVSGVEAYWSTESGPVPGTRYAPVAPAAGTVTSAGAGYGFLVDYSDDSSVEMLARLLERNVVVRSARKPFTVEGRSYRRGALLIRKSENVAAIADTLRRLASETGVAVVGVNTALSSDGPDLGGNDMVLLQQPRIALLAGPEMWTGGFGALWHLLDERLRARVTILYPYIQHADIDKYNVLVLPSSDPGSYHRAVGKQGISKLTSWVERGGTLIGIGGGAAFLADTATGLSAARLREHVLLELDRYAAAVVREAVAGAPVIDSVAVWEGKAVPSDTTRSPKPATADEKGAAEQDERVRTFMPRGAILRVGLDEEDWLAFGSDPAVAAHVFTSNAFLAKRPVRVPARFAAAGELRVSGLLWPEARARWAESAYVMRETRGGGQVILFADDPVFRGMYAGTTRLLLNALFLGPGWGTARKAEW
jgi:hypothetical protein